MQSAFAERGLRAEFFRAVDAARGEHERYPQYDLRASMRHFGQVMRPAEFACFASHYFVWEMCAARGRPVLICEDDLLLAESFPRALELTEPWLPELGLVRLFGTTPRPFRSVAPLGAGFELIRYLRGPSGMVCYALAPDAAARLIRHCPRWLEPADRFLDRFWLHGLGHYAVHPSPVSLRPVASDIGTRRRRKTIHSLPRRLLRVRDHVERIAYNRRL